MKIAEHIMSRCATESFNDTSFIHQDDRTFVRSIWTDSTKLDLNPRWFVKVASQRL